jgi:hypothetical protein
LSDSIYTFRFAACVAKAILCASHIDGIAENHFPHIGGIAENHFPHIGGIAENLFPQIAGEVAKQKSIECLFHHSGSCRSRVH